MIVKRVKTRVAINGFGRIGRQVFKALHEKYPNVEVVAINDLTDTTTLAHLLKYDSNYGTFNEKITAEEGAIKVGSKKILVFAEKDPKNLPWKKLGVTIVIESTGFFTKGELAKAHLEAGAERVIISAPGEGVDKTIVLGVNEADYDPKKHFIISMASCTTNCLAPITKVILDNFGIQRGFMTTVHSYTNDQKILDLPHEDLRRARAAALNIIPTKTGAAKALKEVIPEVEGKLDGYALRVPTPTVSITDLTVITDKPIEIEKVNDSFRKAAAGRMKGYLATTDENLVSMDFKGNPYSSIVDLPLTKVLGLNLLKVVSWYDNEWGYSNRIADLVNFIYKK